MAAATDGNEDGGPTEGLPWALAEERRLEKRGWRTALFR